MQEQLLEIIPREAGYTRLNVTAFDVNCRRFLSDRDILPPRLDFNSWANNQAEPESRPAESTGVQIHILREMLDA